MIATYDKFKKKIVKILSNVQNTQPINNNISAISDQFEKNYNEIKMYLIKFMYMYSKLLVYISKACKLYQKFDKNVNIDGFTKINFTPKNINNILYAEICLTYYKKAIDVEKELDEIIHNINKTILLMYNDKSFELLNFQDSVELLLHVIFFFNDANDEVFQYAYFIENFNIELNIDYLADNIKIIQQVIIEIYEKRNLEFAENIISNLKSKTSVKIDASYFVQELQNDFFIIKKSKEIILKILYESHVLFLNNKNNKNNNHCSIITIIDAFTDYYNNYIDL